MKFKIIIVLTIFSIAGCAYHSEPKGNLDFHQISQLYELAGVYKNKGNPSGYLSWIIWPEIKQIRPDIKEITSPDTDHEDIELIEVIPNDSSLIVKATSNGCSIYDKTYIVERDFKINDGKIVVHREAPLLKRDEGDVLLGPSYLDITLGLDTGKHGKSRSSGYGAGLVLIIPVAFSDISDIWYERVSDKPQVFKNCSGR